MRVVVKAECGEHVFAFHFSFGYNDTSSQPIDPDERKVIGATFGGICILTSDVPRSRDFYAEVLQVQAEGDEDHATLFTAGASLTVFSKRGMEELAPGSTSGSGTGGYTLDFGVPDVDGEYERLKAMNIVTVKVPTTYPWGRRAFWFRDPDGNIVNLFTSMP